MVIVIVVQRLVPTFYCEVFYLNKLNVKIKKKKKKKRKIHRCWIVYEKNEQTL